MPIKRNRPKPTGVPGIAQDGPKRFLVRARWTDPKTGRRRKREGVATTLAKAVALKDELMMGEARAPRSVRLRFEGYVTRWSEIHGRRLDQSTKGRYATALAQAVEEFGGFYVDGFRPADIRVWMSRMTRRCPCGRDFKQEKACACGREKPYVNPTINGWLRVLRVVFDDAVTDGLLEMNPARAVKALPEGRTKGARGTALTLTQFRLALAAIIALVEVKERGKGISPDVARMMLTIAWTGVRRGELMALRFTDMVEGELRIERSVYRRGEKATKTDDPRRITMVQPLAEVLGAQRRWLLEMQHPGLASGLVFPASPRHAQAGATRRDVDELSWYRSPSILDEPLKRVVKAAKIPPISPQSFRRTWENILREAGVDQLVRRALAGWRTEKAQGIYATVDRRERDAASEAVAKLVMGANG